MHRFFKFRQSAGLLLMMEHGDTAKLALDFTRLIFLLPFSSLLLLLFDSIESAVIR